MEITKEELLDMVPDELEELKRFLSKGNHYYEIYDDFLMIDEVEVNGRQYMIEIDMNNEAVRFVDDLVNMDSLINDYNINVDKKEWIIYYSKIEADIMETGFTLRDSGSGGNDDYIWHELVISVFDFTEDGLNKSSQLWTDFNNNRRNMYVDQLTE